MNYDTTMKKAKSGKKSARKISSQPETKVPDYDSDPFFIKKAEAAQKTVDRVGFPEAFLKKK